MAGGALYLCQRSRPTIKGYSCVRAFNICNFLEDL